VHATCHFACERILLHTQHNCSALCPCMLAVMTERTALAISVINGAIVVATAAAIAFLWWS